MELLDKIVQKGNKNIKIPILDGICTTGILVIFRQNLRVLRTENPDSNDDKLINMDEKKGKKYNKIRKKVSGLWAQFGKKLANKIVTNRPRPEHRHRGQSAKELGILYRSIEV